jgi:hypothetical protein
MFLISKKGRKWAMTCEQGYVTDKTSTLVMVKAWTQVIDEIEAELDALDGVSRMSYDTWHWTNKQDMDTWLTYFYLKFPMESFKRILDIKKPTGSR